MPDKASIGVFVHRNALVEEGAALGPGTRVWAFAHILPGATVGEDCNVCDHTFIEGKVRVGNRVTIKCGVFLWDGVVVEDDVFIGPAAVFTNDLTPRSKQYPPQFATTVLRQGCSIGANATILAGTTIGRWAMVGAGAVVTGDAADHALMVGVPARQVGWVCCCGQRLKLDSANRGRCASCGRDFEPSAEGVGVREAGSGT